MLASAVAVTKPSTTRKRLIMSYPLKTIIAFAPRAFNPLAGTGELTTSICDTTFVSVLVTAVLKGASPIIG